MRYDDEWNRVAADWSTRHDWLWRAHADAVNSALCRRWLPANGVGRLLKTDLFDEACGDGLWPTLRQMAAHVDIIDVSPAMATLATARHPAIAPTIADVRGLPFASSSFDAVVSNSTLDHFEDERDLLAALQELHRVLRPGGRLLLTLDNPANPVVWLRNALPYTWTSNLGLVPYFVGATLGAKAMTSHLTRIGFDVKQVTAILHCPRVVAIPWAKRVGAPMAPTGSTQGLLRRLMAFERLEQWPTCFRTGHFVAALGIKQTGTKEAGFPQIHAGNPVS